MHCYISIKISLFGVTPPGFTPSMRIMMRGLIVFSSSVSFLIGRHVVGPQNLPDVNFFGFAFSKAALPKLHFDPFGISSVVDHVFKGDVFVRSPSFAVVVLFCMWMLLPFLFLFLVSGRMPPIFGVFKFTFFLIVVVGVFR